MTTPAAGCAKSPLGPTVESAVSHEALGGLGLSAQPPEHSTHRLAASDGHRHDGIVEDAERSPQPSVHPIHREPLRKEKNRRGSPWTWPAVHEILAHDAP